MGFSFRDAVVDRTRACRPPPSKAVLYLACFLFRGGLSALGHVRPPLVHDARHAAPACAGRVHRDVYGAGVGRAISTGHVKSSGQWCEMLRATRSARASVIVCPDSSRAKKAPWFARCRPAVDRLMPRWAA